MEDLNDKELNIQFGVGISRFLGENDRLVELEYVDLDTKESHALAAGTVIIPAGRFPELIFTKIQPEETASVESSEATLRWEARQPYKAPEYGDDMGLFAEGDALSDFSAAIKAIGAGRRAAATIHQQMYGIEPVLTDDVVTPSSDIQNVDHVDLVDASIRNIMPLCGSQDREECNELEKGFAESTAKEEASRCLQCGLICYERKWEEESYEVQETA